MGQARKDWCVAGDGGEDRAALHRGCDERAGLEAIWVDETTVQRRQARFIVGVWSVCTMSRRRGRRRLIVLDQVEK